MIANIIGDNGSETWDAWTPTATDQVYENSTWPMAATYVYDSVITWYS